MLQAKKDPMKTDSYFRKKTFRNSIFKHCCSEWSQLQWNSPQYAEAISNCDHVWNFTVVKEVLEEAQAIPAKLGESNSSKRVSPESNTAQYFSNSDDNKENFC